MNEFIVIIIQLISIVSLYETSNFSGWLQRNWIELKLEKKSKSLGITSQVEFLFEWIND